MIWFLLVFLAVYGSMQLFVFVELRRAFPAMGAWSVLPAAFLALMVLAPMAVHWLDRPGWFWAARAVSAVGHTWMAVSFWFLVFGGAAELVNLGARLVGLARGAAYLPPVPPRALVAGFGALLAVLIPWGLVESCLVRLERVELAAGQLPAGSEPVVIAQISDLHLGPLWAEGRLERAIRVAESARPDILVMTGDFLDTVGPWAEAWADRLAAVRPRLGKFAVLGNHEAYAGSADCVRLLERAGFRVLRAESVSPAPGLLLAGVDDPALSRSGGGAARLDEDACLPPAGARGEFVVLLKHQPRVEPASRGRFDLQLSGHSHHGQIFPFAAVVAAVYRYRSGLYELDGGARLYVSRGTGTWGPPLRFLSPPEVAAVTLRPGRAETNHQDTPSALLGALSEPNGESKGKDTKKRQP